MHPARPLTAAQTARRLTCGLLALLVAACAAPVQAPPQTEPAPQWQQAPDAPEAPVVQDWWQELQQPELNALLDRALADNPQNRQNEELLRAAQALSGAVDAADMPQLSAGTEDAIAPAQGKSYFVAGLQLEWQLPLHGSREARRAYAQGALDFARARWQLSQHQLAHELISHWLALGALQQEQALLQEQTQDLTEQSRILQERQALQLEARNAGAELQRARLQLQQQESALATRAKTHEYALAALLDGAPVDPQWAAQAANFLARSWQAPEAVPPPPQWMASNPAVDAARAQLDMALGQAGLAEARRYPSIGLGASLLWASHISTWRHDHDHGWFSLGPVIDIPLLDWGRRKAEAQARQHELQAASWTLRQTVIQGVTAVETALAQQQASQAQWESSQQLLALEEEAHGQQAALLAGGLLEPLQIHAQTGKLREARQQSIQASLQRAQAWADLQLALHGNPDAQAGAAAPEQP